jgi:hypothetical protein
MRFINLVSFDNNESWSLADWIKFGIVLLCLPLILWALHEWDLHDELG